MVQRWASSHNLPRSDRTLGPQVPVLTTVTDDKGCYTVLAGTTEHFSFLLHHLCSSSIYLVIPFFCSGVLENAFETQVYLTEYCLLRKGGKGK